MYELIAGTPLLEVFSLDDYRARLAALHTMDLQVSLACPHLRNIRGFVLGIH